MCVFPFNKTCNIHKLFKKKMWGCAMKFFAIHINTSVSDKLVAYDEVNVRVDFLLMAAPLERISERFAEK